MVITLFVKKLFFKYHDFLLCASWYNGVAVINHVLNPGADVPRLVRGIQTGADFFILVLQCQERPLDPADKPRDVGAGVDDDSI
jgi:hypothetical protein